MRVSGAEVCLHAVVVVCAMALGGAPEWVVWPLILLPTVAAGFTAASAVRHRAAVIWPLPVWPPLLMVAVCCLQLVPLPAAALRHASPFAASLREFALVPLGIEGPRPITLDAPSTWRELATWLAYALIIVVAANVSVSRRARKRLLATLALTGFVASVIAFGHLLVDAQALFGVYRYSFAPRLTTVFANMNHFSAFLTLSTLAAFALAAGQRGARARLFWGMTAAACVGAAFLSGSRGGSVFLVLGVVLFLLLELRRQAAESGAASPRFAWMTPALVGVVVVGLAGYGAWELLSERLHSISSLSRLEQTKIQFWPAMMSGALEFWRLGMGRGAYALGGTAFQREDPTVVFTHPENIVLQLTSEMGTPLAALFFALSAGVAWRLWKQSGRGAIEAAALAAVVAIGLHELFDFALELPATAAALAAMLGATFGQLPANREVGGARLAAMVPVAAALGVTGALLSQPDYRDAENELEALVRGRVAPALVETRARALVARHEADYALYVLAARSASGQGGQPQLALAWVNRALFLRPIDVESHRSAARALLKLGRRSQALLEYRLAGDSVSLSEGVRSARTVDELEILAVTSSLRLTVAHELVRIHRSADAEALLARALDEAPALRLLAAQLAVARGDFVTAQLSLDRAAQLNPDSVDLARARAQLARAQGDTKAAFELLRALTIKHPDVIDAAFELAELLLGMGHPRDARDVLARASPFIVSQQVRAQKMVIEARAYEADRSWAKAVASYESAARLAPAWDYPHLQIASLYEKLGKFDEAERAIHAAARAVGMPLTEEKRAWIERLQKAEADRALRSQPTDDPLKSISFDE